MITHHLRVHNRTRGTLLGDHIAVADGFWTRLRGLLGRDGLEEGEGLLIAPSRGVHMFGMRFPLDVLLLDREQRVQAGFAGLAPGKATGMRKGVRYALELPSGTIAATGTHSGDTLEWETA
ncbi:MAG: DUF192 domain-containing protein [Thermoanaerobaculia bacterium]